MSAPLDTTHTTDTTDTTDAAGVDAPTAPATEGLGALLAPVRGRLVLGCVLFGIGAAVGIVPLLAVVEIARALVERGPVDEDRVRTLGMVILTAFALRGALQLVAGSITHFADNDLQLSLRRQLAQRLGRVPLGWFSERSSGLIKQTVADDVASMHHVVAHAAVDLTAAVVAPTVALVALFVVSWPMGLVVLVPTLVAIVIYMGQMAASTRYMGEYGTRLAGVNAAAVEFVQGIAVVKAFGQTGRAHGRFLAAANAFVDFFWSMVRRMLRWSAANEVLMSPLSSLVVVLAVGTWFVDRGWIDAVDLVAAVVLGVGLTRPMLVLGHSLHQLQIASAAAQRVGTVLATPILVEGTVDDPTAGDGSVTFSGVSFGYRDAPVLHDVDFTLAPGTITALVGPSGSGKTTIAHLVPRFWDVDGGVVRVGGDDVRDLPPAVLYRRVSFVFQDVALLHLSVRENLRLAVPDASDEQVEAAARAAQIHDRVAALPRGYDSIVGEDATFSGGESQRLSIARALLRDTPIVVLDEATAALDPDSEAAIQDALSELVAGRTVLVIAHRLSTITNVDQILVLDHGRIVERGTHGQLLARQGRYAALWERHERVHTVADDPTTTATEARR